MKRIVYVLILILLCNFAFGVNVIITPDLFYNQAAELSNLHSLNSITSQVVNISSILNYEDNFTIDVDGSDSRIIHYDYNSSLAKKIISFLNLNSFDNVILFGDSQLIPPSYYIYDNDGIDADDRWIPTDFFYSSPDLDLVVDVPVGRIPVKNLGEINNYLAKLTNWYTNTDIDDIVVAGGDPTNNNRYYGELIISKSIVDLAGKNINRLYSTSNAFNKSTFIDSFSSDLIYVVGHGTVDSMSFDDGDFSVSDIDSLNQTSYPIIFSSLCNNGAFDSGLTGSSVSLGESMLIKQKGGVAFIGSSRLSYGLPVVSYEDGVIDIDQTMHSSELIEDLIDNYVSGGNSIGAITKKAINDYISGHDMSNNLEKRTVFGFVLLGDPSMKLTYNSGTRYDSPYLTALNPTEEKAIPYYYVKNGNSVKIDLSTNSPNVSFVLLKDYSFLEQSLRNDDYEFFPISDGFYYLIAEGYDSQESRMILNVSIDHTIDPIYSISVDPVNFDENERNITVSKQINIVNTGNSELVNLTIDSNAWGVYDVKFSPSLFDLSVNESKTIDVSAFIPLGVNSGEYKIGSLNFRSGSFLKSIDITSNAKNELELSELRAYHDNRKKTITGEDTVVDVSPGESFKIEVELTNLMDKYDIDVVITANFSQIVYDSFENEYEDIVVESDTFTVRDGKSDEGTVTLNLPKLLDIGIHSVYISIEGIDDNGAKHYANSKFLINVEKDDYVIEITKAELSYETINCESVSDLDVRITNIGEKDADVVLSVLSSKLGINIEKEVFLASEIDSDINEYSRTIEINGESIEAGEYSFDIIVERNGKIKDSKSLILVVESCEEEEWIVTESETLAQQNIEDLNQQVYTSSKSFKETSTYKMMIAIIVVLWVGFIIFVIGAVIIGAGKRN